MVKASGMVVEMGMIGTSRVAIARRIIGTRGYRIEGDLPLSSAVIGCGSGVVEGAEVAEAMADVRDSEIIC
ncbi:hypothetical protein L6452_01930 [Arctium lappa]|uniref:Uncharacterized protein n=1 Tax=Arctium lappa TaxID=4217 RepID=A0ACB9FJB2_ARCLA|nr:hypothetical protein L6452_01930 [Arctium lappa]